MKRCPVAPHGETGIIEPVDKFLPPVFEALLNIPSVPLFLCESAQANNSIADNR
jgi:hypothetical protein